MICVFHCFENAAKQPVIGSLGRPDFYIIVSNVFTLIPAQLAQGGVGYHYINIYLLRVKVFSHNLGVYSVPAVKVRD